MKRLLPAMICGLLILTASARTEPVRWNFGVNFPPVIQDTTQPRQCTVTWLVTDTATNDVYAARMRITPTDDAKAEGDRLPCPGSIPPRMADRALDACVSRAAEQRDCVFADMSRGFEQQPLIRNSAENTSRCSSDKASQIGIACWKSGTLDVCNVGCGDTAEHARADALSRCAEKQQKTCNEAGSIAVLPPD